MIWGVILCAALAPRPCSLALPTTPTTVTMRATTVDKAVAALAKETGVRLEVDQPMSREVVILRTKNVPADDLLKRLANVLLARWESREGTWRLVRDATLEVKATEKRQAQRLAYAAALLTDVRKQLAKSTAWSSQESYALAEDVDSWMKSADPRATAQLRDARAKSEAALSGRTPGTRATKRALATLSKEQIALVFDGRTVFADRPTAAQVRLPIDLSPILNQWVSEQNEWAQSVEAKMPSVDPERPVARRTFIPNDHGYSEEIEPLVHTRPVSGPLAKALLILVRRNDSLVARLMIAGSDGDFVLQGLYKHPDPESAGPTASGSERRIPFSEEAQQVAKATDYLHYKNTVLPAELRRKVLHPQEFEPLGFSATDLVLGLPESPDANIVACLPDSALEKARTLAVTGETSVAAWAAENRRSDGIEWTEAGGWLTVAPRDPLWSRKSRTERASMGKLMRRVIGDGGFTIDDLVEFKRSNLTVRSLGLANAFFNAMAPGVDQRLWRNDDTALRILAGIGESERKALCQGASLPVGSLPIDLQQYLTDRFVREDRLIGGGSRLPVEWYDNDQYKASAARDRARVEKMMTGRHVPDEEALVSGGYGSLGEESTELFGNGFPKGASVSLELKRQETVFAASTADGADSVPQDYSESSIAQFLMIKRKYPNEATWTPDRFRPGWKAPDYVHVRLTPDWEETFSLYEDSLWANAPLLGLDDLPADFRKRLAQKIEECSKQNVTFGHDGSPTGPINP